MDSVCSLLKPSKPPVSYTLVFCPSMKHAPDAKIMLLLVLVSSHGSLEVDLQGHCEGLGKFSEKQPSCG